jgi:hypothetical protein
VSSGAVQQQGCVHMSWQGDGEAVEEGLHGRRTNLRQDEGKGLVGAGPDRAEDPG